MKKIVLASSNQGKINELNALLASMNIEVLPQSAFAVPDVIEDGLSFVENALKKARNAARATGLPALADDSGLAVDALNGAPGIYSARYAGEGASDEDNWRKLLDQMKHLPETERAARFHCVLVLMQHAEDPTPLICHGQWRGSILRSPAGTGGFGYDPVFLVGEHQCSAAQLDKQEKNAISHRGQALQLLRQQMQYLQAHSD
ncbi:MAG: non-canonical purine NTP pyrophosphatase [Proteobacteria bacterium]|nr:MAG: non-canonical purine NTP pyrophosphatase [Pseudomonadota bacterium]